MKRRWRLLCLAVTLCLWLSGLLVWLTLPGPRISQTSFEQIRPGMTRAEVEAVLGVSAGNYTGGRVKIVHGVPPDDGYAEWVGEDVAVLVWLDDEGRVSRKECLHTSHLIGRDDSLLRKLRRWLPW
jgi:hypothetical protein